MSKAEVMIIAMVAALHYRGNFARACKALHEQNYMPRMVSASRFNRRLHRIKPLFLTLSAVLREEFKRLNGESVYGIDTFPIAACDTYRIRRYRRYIVGGKAYNDYAMTMQWRASSRKLNFNSCPCPNPFMPSRHKAPN
jgi:hypothetical protein